ncbi:hypothetical protein TREMEDRAFT_40223 [Tremella mesenterica DSM 1558]|uniref:uncharacterized protein n=1 Tax=Tremella mesenterica (strain ATCC 24925 / CBS 8224 / DSM 1558 / NBRC 9311 / NRRL Y-6157 / RJB 2259-6 / UBC 559-6) TaxID=578456 RepID=UPI0003F4A473|nr:uncharacterized protein TREMEDRAFT_40223 [Tremella mesenterica DSM 1558]EIW68122.1 hypothetical protein TREMEDRAFT_40223 [Tremella mesenterica DSM 1558]
MPPSEKIKVGVLGATGTVGQRFIQLLSTHPYFVLHSLGASARSAGQTYSSVTRWKLSSPMPEIVRDMMVHECRPDVGGFDECGVVFSGLDHDVAGEIEESFRSSEIPIFSNAKNHRRDPLVPLIVPLVNSSHLSIIPQQQSLLGLKKGFILCNANCSTTGVVVPLAALEKSFGPLKTVMITTLQAISGAGYPGVSSMDIMDNVVPFIGGEEEKIEWETLKILGGIKEIEHQNQNQIGKNGKNETKLEFDHHQENKLKISAQCNRVPVLDGHLSCVSVEFSKEAKPTLKEIENAFKNYTSEAQELNVPSAPKSPIILHESQDRPQPRLDRDLENGACVSVGRIRECGVLDFKFICLVDNVRLGAATSSVMNAEIAVEKGYVR